LRAQTRLLTDRTARELGDADENNAGERGQRTRSVQNRLEE